MKNTLNLARHSVHLARIPLRRGVTPPPAAPSYAAKTEAKVPGCLVGDLHVRVENEPFSVVDCCWQHVSCSAR